MGYGSSNHGSEYIFHHLPSGKCPSINCSMYVYYALGYSSNILVQHQCTLQKLKHPYFLTQKVELSIYLEVGSHGSISKTYKFMIANVARAIIVLYAKYLSVNPHWVSSNTQSRICHVHG